MSDPVFLGVIITLAVVVGHQISSALNRVWERRAKVHRGP